MCTVGKAQSLRAFRTTLTLLDIPQSAFRPIVYILFKLVKTTSHAVKFHYMLQFLDGILLKRSLRKPCRPCNQHFSLICSQLPDQSPNYWLGK